MARKYRQCGTCNAVYPHKQDDGSTYYHACAPVGMNADGTSQEKANKRDENTKLKPDGTAAGNISDGLGFTDL